MFARELRDLAFVPRWGIVRCIRQQSVAEHSYYVTIYAVQIAQIIHWSGPMADLMKMALSHDWNELLTGDLPSPAKRVLKKAAGEKWFDFEEWCNTLMEKRIPGYLTWVAPIVPKQHEDSWLEGAEAILRAADLLEAVLFLSEEQQLGNQNLSDRKHSLTAQLQKAVLKLPCSEGVQTVVLSLMHNAIKKQTGETSMIVLSGDET